VIATVSDPVRFGLVASLARPGGNVTGLTSQSFELAPKRLELLKQAAPKSSRVGVLQVPGTQPEPVAESSWKELVTAGRSLGMQLQRWDVRGRNDLAAAFSAMTRDGANALFVSQIVTLSAHLTEIAGLAAKHRLPAIAGPREFAEAGGALGLFGQYQRPVPARRRIRRPDPQGGQAVPAMRLWRETNRSATALGSSPGPRGGPFPGDGIRTARVRSATGYTLYTSEWTHNPGHTSPAQPRGVIPRSCRIASRPSCCAVHIRPVICPPSTTMSWPVTNEDSSLAKKTASAATSSGIPVRGIG